MMPQFATTLRSLSREPLWTAVAVLTLALGISVNAAVFSIVQALLLRALPYPQAQRLTFLFQENQQEGRLFDPVTPADYFDMQHLDRSFSGITSYSVAPVDTVLTGKGEPRVIRQLLVDGNFFDVMGVQPTQGKGLRLADAQAPEGPVVVLSHHLWRELGSNPKIAGQTLVLNGLAYEVRGVMPPGFTFPNSDVDLWAPLPWPNLTRANGLLRKVHTLRVVGLLRPGVSLAAARSDVQSLAARLARAYPETNRSEGAGVVPLRDWLVRDLRLSLFLLWATSGLVLLIACANVASLQVMRGLARTREMATYVALGAPRTALVQRSLAEILLLALFGGVLGFLVSGWVSAAIVEHFPGELPRAGEVASDGGVAFFTVLLTAGAALLSGLLPSLHATRRVVADALKLGGPATPGPRRSRSLTALLLVEAALTTMLLLGVSFLVRSLVELQRVQLGFQPEGLTTVELSLPSNDYGKEERMSAFYQQLLEHVRNIPGVEAAALTDTVPLTGLRWFGTVQAEGPGGTVREAAFHHRVVSADYFRTLGVQVLHGSTVPNHQHPESSGVVINQTLAERCFGASNPIGRRVRFKREEVEDSGWLTVVGVVAAERIESLAAEPSPDLFESYFQDPDRWLRLVVRSKLPQEALLRELKRAAWSIDPRVPLSRARSMEEIIGASSARERFLLLLMGSLAVLAVVLAGVGIFAVTAYSVGRRRREIGIRLALGATHPQVQRTIVGESMRIVALGGLLGLVPALTLLRLLRSHLFGIAPTDATAILHSAVALLLVTLLPAYLAARRAARIGPTLPIREA